MLAFLSLVFTLLFVNIVHSAPSAVRRGPCIDCTLERDLDARAVVISVRHEGGLQLTFIVLSRAISIKTHRYYKLELQPPIRVDSVPLRANELGRSHLKIERAESSQLSSPLAVDSSSGS
ncbi:hypothetical protein B0H13DRAFT_1894873 [Mycena leptocephala]|nr:hypothetical protein B0H13DRAFT_1894873 [Mycena leptocephala]